MFFSWDPNNITKIDFFCFVNKKRIIMCSISDFKHSKYPLTIFTQNSAENIYKVENKDKLCGVL